MEQQHVAMRIHKLCGRDLLAGEDGVVADLPDLGAQLVFTLIVFSLHGLIRVGDLPQHILSRVSWNSLGLRNAGWD